MKKIAYCFLLVALCLFTGCCSQRINKVVGLPVIENSDADQQYKQMISPLSHKKVFTLQSLSHIFIGYECYPTHTSFWQPDMAWVNDAYASFQHFLEQNNLHYNNHFKCADYASLFVEWSRIYNYEHNLKKTNNQEVPAIGEIYYVKDGKPVIFHAINIIILDDNDIIFFEPQTGEIVDLSENEIKSIYVIIF